MKKIATLIAAMLVLAAIPYESAAKKAPKELTPQQIEQTAALQAAIANRTFVFDARQINTQIPRKPFVDLTNRENFVVIGGETVNSQLSYMGVSTMTYTDLNSPLDFNSKITLYETRGELTDKKGVEVKIETTAKNNRLCKMMFYIYDDGTANLYVDATGFSRIVYRGAVTEKK